MNDERSSMQFPWKLHQLLNDAENEGFQSIVCWSPQGHSFKVYKKETFAADIMPRYFQSSKYKSFQRNLSLWGFETVLKGAEKGCCFHPCFVRFDISRCNSMKRVRVKGKNPAKSWSSFEVRNGDKACERPPLRCLKSCSFENSQKINDEGGMNNVSNGAAGYSDEGDINRVSNGPTGHAAIAFGGGGANSSAIESFIQHPPLLDLLLAYRKEVITRRLLTLGVVLGAKRECMISAASKQQGVPGLLSAKFTSQTPRWCDPNMQNIRFF